VLPLRCAGLEVSPVTHEHAISDSPRHDTDVLKMYYVSLVTNVFVAHLCLQEQHGWHCEDGFDRAVHAVNGVVFVAWRPAKLRRACANRTLLPV